MALNLDTTFRLKAKVEGAKSVDSFKRQLKSLDTSSKMSKAQLGKMNIEINRMARAAGNTTKGLREHIKALTILRDRTDIGGKAYKRLGNQIDSLKRKLKGLDGQAASTGQKLAGLLATVGVGRAIRGVIGGASRYEEEVTKTAAIEGSGNFKQIDEGIRATAQIAAGTPQDVAELATELARMGRNADEITGSLNGIVLGAEATSTSFADMGRIVGTTMEVFGIDVEKTERAVDILTAGANNSAQNMTILGESMKVTAPIAATLGVTLNDTVATLGLLADAGIRGSEAGTGLRTGLQRLVIAGTGAEGKLLGITRGSKMLTTAMKELGAEVLDANGQLKPLDEVIKSLRDNMAGRSQGEQMEIAKALFGTEQGGKFLALIQNADDEIDSMFSTIRNSADVAQRTRKQMESFGLTTKILGGNFQIVTNQIGAAFIAVLHPLAKLLNTLLTAASKLPTPIKGIASAFAAAGLTALSLKVTMISLNMVLGKGVIITKLVAGFMAFKKALLAAKVAVIAFNATNPVGWIALAVSGLIALGGLIYKFRKQIMAIGETFKEMITEYVVKVYNQLPEFLRKIISGVGGKINIVVSKTKEVVQTTVEGVKDSASNILGGTTVAVDKDTENEQNEVLEGMKSALEEYRTKALDVAANVKSAMTNALQGMEDALVNFVMTGKLAFDDLARSIISSMARIVIQKTIMAPFTGWLDTILGNANGNAFSNGEVEKFAYGGSIVNRPTLFPMKNGMGLMGEAGAEAIMPLKRGKDGKLGVTAQGGGSNVVNVSVNASGTSAQGNTMKASQLGKMIGTAIEAELIKQKRPGGILYT